MLINLHEAGQIIVTVTIIRCLPNDYETFVDELLLRVLLLYLICARDQLYGIKSTKVFNGCLSEQSPGPG
jgi:hypothetical protein